MRKVLLSLVAVLAFAGLAFSAAPTTPTIYGPMDWKIAERVNDACAKCAAGSWIFTTVTRITGTSDTAICTKVPAEPGWSYLLSVLDSAGAAADSVKIVFKLYGSDGTTLMNTSAIDTLVTGATFKTISVPIGLTQYGKSFSITATGIGANVKKITRVELWKRRAATKSLW
jgi:hypothetical protein